MRGFCFKFIVYVIIEILEHCVKEIVHGNLDFTYALQVFDELSQWKNQSISEGIGCFIRHLCFSLRIGDIGLKKTLVETRVLHGYTNIVLCIFVVLLGLMVKHTLYRHIPLHCIFAECVTCVVFCLIGMQGNWIIWVL